MNELEHISTNLLVYAQDKFVMTQPSLLNTMHWQGNINIKARNLNI